MPEDFEPMSQYDDETDAVRLGIIPAESVYCEHGRYVGGWAGGDYLCGYCEDGVSMAQLEAEHMAAAIAGELCAFRGSLQLPGETALRVLVWHVFCVPVGPCQHIADHMAREPHPLSFTDGPTRAFWVRAGAITYHTEMYR